VRVSASANKTGYTLLEILLVLMILAGAGFFLLIQIPNDTQEKGIELSALRLLEDLREVQQAAMADNIWYKVKFYPATSTYKIFRQGEFIRSVVFQEGVRFGNSPPEVIFQPIGAPTVGMTVVLKTTEKERHVIIAPIMGRMRIEIVR